jgi:hypothetical protein
MNGIDDYNVFVGSTVKMVFDPCKSPRKKNFMIEHMYVKPFKKNITVLTIVHGGTVYELKQLNLRSRKIEYLGKKTKFFLIFIHKTVL